MRAACRAVTTRFDRQRDDVLIVDNTPAAHGRAPFTGPYGSSAARPKERAGGGDGARCEGHRHGDRPVTP
nr:TauD/TfdA family dioxygenase [Streptomyces sp. SID11385]